MIGSSNGHSDTVKYFIEKGFDWNIKDEAGKTALHFGKIIRFDLFLLLFLFFTAPSNGHFDTVKYFKEKGFDGNIKDEAGKTALHFGEIILFHHF